MPLNITITDAGRAEIINAENTGTGPVVITEIGFGTAQYAPSKSQLTLQAEAKRVNSIAGQAVAFDTIHVMAKDEGPTAYNVGEFGLFSAAGTLVAVYSQSAASGWIIQKSGASTLLLATDIILESLDATSLTFGDILFINPPATTEVPGVVELATAVETQDGLDGVRAVTPAGLKSLTASLVRAGLVQLVNTLTSSSTSQALTAAQGKKLQDEKAPLANPALTGVPTAPTAAAGTNTTQLANTAFVQAALAALVDASPSTLNTLNELAAALGDDPNFATTITTALGLKAPLASPALTGTPTAPTAAPGTNTTQLATTAFVDAVETLLNAALALKAPLASPALTGAPTAPTAAAGTNTAQLANTAFVQAAIAALVDASPGTLNTLNELAAALGDDPNFATTITTALGLKAPLASPALTGVPTAPTAQAGTNTTHLATTAFVQAAINAVLAKSVAGGVTVTLTAVEAGYPIIKLVGALTANISVVVPNTMGQWVIWNATTGAFTVTVKTAAGSGVLVTQGTAWQLLCDAANVIDANSDFKDIALTGVPTAPTAVAGTNTTQLATTAFVSAVQALLNTAIGLKAPLANPALTGVPTAPTAAVGTNTAQLANTAFVQAAIAALVDASPGTLNTLNELAAALGDDPNFATTIATALGLKAPLASPALTGTPTAPTAAPGTNTTQLATTAFVSAEIANDAYLKADFADRVTFKSNNVNGQYRVWASGLKEMWLGAFTLTPPFTLLNLPIALNGLAGANARATILGAGGITSTLTVDFPNTSQIRVYCSQNCNVMVNVTGDFV